MKYTEDNLEWHDENELIRKLDAVEAVLNMADSLEEVVDILMTVPSVDAGMVRVVRCKECRYCKRKRGTFKGEPITFYRCTENNRDVEIDDYCSFGEREGK